MYFFYFFHQKNWVGGQFFFFNLIRLRRYFLQQWQYVDQLEIPTHEGLGLANQNSPPKTYGIDQEWITSAICMGTTKNSNL